MHLLITRFCKEFGAVIILIIEVTMIKVEFIWNEWKCYYQLVFQDQSTVSTNNIVIGPLIDN